MKELIIKPEIENSWKEVLKEEFNKDYFARLKLFLLEERKIHRTYPAGREIFAAFNLTPFNKVKVVVLGQDPYHGKNQAHGLSFSVPDGIKPPPSLVNIFKELNNDLDATLSGSGNLSKWADQGILLLNAVLTVRAGEPGSHQNKGWEQFTDAVIQLLSAKKDGLVFLLWGRFAQKKEELIDASKHHILKAPHPSPFSAHSGFFGCRHFSKTNHLLTSQGKEEINWTI